MLGTLGGLWAWWQGGGLLWLVSAVLLFAVVPFTILVIMPVNHQLLAAGRSPEQSDSR